MRKTTYCLLLICHLCSFAKAQNSTDTIILNEATLAQCIQYALTYQPVIKQSLLAEDITDRQIKSRLADWYPQVGLSYNYTHYFDLPTSIFQDKPNRVGVNNNSTVAFSLSQTIFNSSALLASRSASEVRKQAKQSTTSHTIDVIANVSKAFYDVLLTEQQISLVDEDIVRIAASLKDAYEQYKGGLVDKTDYKRATITLNNANASKKQREEMLKARIAYLKDLMGYPANAALQLKHDSAAMTDEIVVDTLSEVNYSDRIEIQLLQTQRQLDQYSYKYTKWSFIPSIYAVGAYNFNFMNNDFSSLYNQNYPSSYAGLTLAVPLFQGMKRTHQMKAAEMAIQQTDYDIQRMQNAISDEYQQAISVYKSNLTNYRLLDENRKIAKEVYDVIDLQYREGVKTYLDVITAETDLRTAEENYLDALFQVLSSKIDVQKAKGEIK